MLDVYMLALLVTLLSPMAKGQETATEPEAATGETGGE